MRRPKGTTEFDTLRIFLKENKESLISRCDWLSFKVGLKGLTTYHGELLASCVQMWKSFSAANGNGSRKRLRHLSLAVPKT